jgi:hypothetical protein
VKKTKALSIPPIRTLEQADAHQRKHGFPPLKKEDSEIFQQKKLARGIRIGTRQMTQTELEFQAMLMAQQAHGEILKFRFEGIRLLWGDGMSFKVDFVVQNLDRTIKLIEVKGARKLWKHELVRFKGCRAEWKDWFEFEFWRKDENALWNRLA